MAGIVNYKVAVAGAVTNLSKVAVNILDKRKQSVASGTGEEGKLSVAGATLWWPYTMNATHFGYMYTLQVRLWKLQFAFFLLNFFKYNTYQQ